MTRSGYRDRIAEVCREYQLDPTLLEAQVLVESGDHPYAWNPEPRYKYLWNVRTGQPFRPLSTIEQARDTPPTDFPCLAGDRDQEWWGQRVSWGLLQVMGAVAREHGFAGAYLPELTRPEINLAIGARHVRRLLTWAQDNPWQALAAYNGGTAGNTAPPYRNEAYVRDVRRTWNDLLATGGQSA